MFVMWKRLCLVFGISLSMMSLVLAAEETPPLTSAEPEKPKLEVDFSTTYTSRYMWRGYDVFDDHAALQPSATVDLFGSGFSINTWGSIPMGSGYEDLSELDYTIAYGASYFEDEKYALDVSANYIYYDFYKVKSKGADTE